MATSFLTITLNNFFLPNLGSLFFVGIPFRITYEQGLVGLTDDYDLLQ